MFRAFLNFRGLNFPLEKYPFVQFTILVENPVEKQEMGTGTR